jgi:hypothetical protein
MSNYKGHLAGGLFFYFIVMFLLSLSCIKIAVALQWFIAILAGALFPDLDIKSKGQKIYYRLVFCIIALCAFYNIYKVAVVLSLVSMIPLMVKHRGLFHKWWFLLVYTVSIAYSLLLYFPAYSYHIISSSIFFFIGIISHLWLDMGFKRMLKIW